MNNWLDKISNKQIFFVTADVKRGLGLEDLLSAFHIICGKFDPLIPVLRRQGAQIYCLEEEGDKLHTRDNNTGRILENQKVADYIQRKSDNDVYISYFKPSPKIDSLIKTRGYKTIGNTSDINELFENKINSASIFKKYLPEWSIPTRIEILGEFNYSQLHKEFGSPFIIQFGHGWAGKTTHLITSESDFLNLRNRYIHTKVRVSRFIDSYTVLNNCCIYKNDVLIGPSAIQINGITSLDENPFASSGRQWPCQILDKSQEKEIKDISRKIGRILINAGFRGWFGIDFLVEQSSGKVFISEINARMTASCAFYTKRELQNGLVPLFAYHLASFLGVDLDKPEFCESIVGTQIVVRNLHTANRFARYPDVGTYTVIDEKVLLNEKSYHPDKLQKDEYILLKGNNLVKKDSEKVRIEMVKSGVDRNGKITSFLEEVFGASYLEKVDKH